MVVHDTRYVSQESPSAVSEIFFPILAYSEGKSPPPLRETVGKKGGCADKRWMGWMEWNGSLNSMSKMRASYEGAPASQSVDLMTKR